MSDRRISHNFVPLALLFAFLYITYVYFIFPRLSSPFRRLKRPEGAVFPLGHIVTLATGSPGSAYASMLRIANGSDEFIRISFLGREHLVATSREAIHRLFAAKVDEFLVPMIAITMLEGAIEHTILSAQGAEHRDLRKSLLPTFQPDYVRRLAPATWKSAEKLRDSLFDEYFLSETGQYQNIDLFPWILRGVFRGITSASLSVDTTDDEVGKQLLDYYEDINPVNEVVPPLQALFSIVASFFLPPYIVEKLRGEQAKKSAAARKKISQIYRDISKQRLAVPDRADEDLLDRMLRSEYNQNLDHAAQQMNAVMMAGHETTAATVAWALWELALTPNHQERIREEWLASGLSGSSEMTAEQIDSLPFLDGFVQEVLRLYPAVPIILKEAATDLNLRGQFVPKGTTIHLPVYAYNRDERVWGPSAGLLLPERWTKRGEGPQASLKDLDTFAHGSRSCLGRDYAYRAIKSFVAILALNFEFRPVPGQTIEFQKAAVTLRPSQGGVPLLVRRL